MEKESINELTKLIASLKHEIPKNIVILSINLEKFKFSIHREKERK